jgi:enoyl-CoA hydratase/carnithine racemase/GNAT superfamily N-acetyltransferase
MNHNLSFELSEKFTPEMDALRRTFSDNQWTNGTSEDEFDSDSFHLVARVDSEIVGMVRITFQPRSPLLAWAKSKHFVPKNFGNVEATRAVVAPDWRGHGIFKWIMASLVVWCHRNEVGKIIGVIEPDFPTFTFLVKLGFQSLGHPTKLLNPPNGECDGQIIALDAGLAVKTAEEFIDLYTSRWQQAGNRFEPEVKETASSLIAAIDGNCLKLSFNRPEKMNAIDYVLLCRLYCQFRTVSRNEELRVILLAGEGRCFSAGADLDSLASEDRKMAMDFVEFGAEVVRILADLGKPVVAMIHGHAVAGGLEIALACSFRIASIDCRFSLPEIHLGIIPGWRGAERVAALAGPSRAFYLAVTGNQIDSQTAQAWDVVDLIVPPSELANRTLEICHSIANGRPAAVRLLGKNILNWGKHSDTENLSKGFEMLFQSHGTKESIQTHQRFIKQRSRKATD